MGERLMATLRRLAYRWPTREVRRVRRSWDPGERFQRDFEDGWLPIVERVHRAVPKGSPDYKLVGAVERNGDLKLGLDATPRWPSLVVEGRDLVYMVANDARARATITCEICGRPGKPVNIGIAKLKVLCRWDRIVANLRILRRDPGRGL